MRKHLPWRTLGTQAGVAAPPAWHGEKLTRIVCDAGELWMPESDGVMRPYLEERGTWEPEEGALLQQYFRPGLRFLDVGANVGYFSLLVAKLCPDAVIHAFEPHPLTQRLLALNAWGSGGNITAHGIALSDGDRLLGLTTAPTNLGDTRTRPDGQATMLSPAAPLDEVLPAAQFDLVKIDVQGFETEVVSGMTSMIQRSPNVVLVAEFWPQALRERGLDPVDVVRTYGTLGLTIEVQVGKSVQSMTPVEIVRVCDQAGPAGQVNLVLTRS